jgi:hypothetical protein
MPKWSGLISVRIPSSGRYLEIFFVMWRWRNEDYRLKTRIALMENLRAEWGILPTH